MIWFNKPVTIPGLNHVEKLNARFQLKVPTKDSPNFFVRKSTFPCDDSISSNCSRQSSNNSVDAKRVRFCSKVVEFQSVCNYTAAEQSFTWYNNFELSDIKYSLKRIYQQPRNDDPIFLIAVMLAQRLLLLQKQYEVIDADEQESTNQYSEEQQRLLYKEVALVLRQNDARGLERMFYGKSTMAAKSVHVQNHVQSVLATQAQCKNMSPDKRATAIAAKCQSSLSSNFWAQVIAEVDSDSCYDDIELQPITKTLKSLNIESFTIEM